MLNDCSLTLYIISIDAETSPSKNNSSTEPPTNPKDENKPGSLTFLDAQEQIMVKKLLANYVKGEVKEVGMQTEQERESINENTFVLPQKNVGDKWVQTEVSPTCKC